MRTQHRTPVIVKGPYPTVEEIAKTMRVSPPRMRAIVRLVDEIHDRNEKKDAKRRAAVRRRQTKTA
ncbi:MAG TPA: hypothetical protein VMT15_17510 [Bryobacteraceae bacterium]|nr:hypothetical protein [Bryobacteraceae bacterium]